MTNNNMMSIIQAELLVMKHIGAVAAILLSVHITIPVVRVRVCIIQKTEKSFSDINSK